LLSPGPPLRVAAQLAALRTWGFGLGGEVMQAAARDPGRVALVDDGPAPLTYAALRDRAAGLARALRAEHGIGPGDAVGVLCRNHRGFVLSTVALALLGADAVLVNTAFSAAQVASVARGHDLRLVIHDAEFPAPPGPALDAGRLEEVAAAAPPGPVRPPERSGRTIVLTSGTTGTPKGARRQNPAGLGPLATIIDRIPVHAHDRMLIAAPLFHTWGYAALQVAVALRAMVVLSRRFSPSSTVDLLRRHRCAALFAVPVMLERLLEADLVLPGVRVVAVSGSALPGDLATRFMDVNGEVLYNLYGSTEVSWATIATPADLRRSPSTAGRPAHGTRVVILSPSGEPVPPGTVGRIFVGNEMLFDGYTTGSSVESRDGLLATGDLGRLDRDGMVRVEGREDDMVIVGGENVHPAAVEDVLAALPEVREVAVVGVPDRDRGQALAAYIALQPGADLPAEEVREHVRVRLARFAVPRDVVFVTALPRTATGKVIKHALLPP